jgi:hypothetical protein
LLLLGERGLLLLGLAEAEGLRDAVEEAACLRLVAPRQFILERRVLPAQARLRAGVDACSVCKTLFGTEECV